METANMSPQFIEEQRKVLEEVYNRLSGKKRIVQETDAQNGCDFGDVSAAMTAADNAMALISNSTQVLREVETALKKIKSGTYGLCESSGNPIGQERLEAIPWARFSIEVQRDLEKDSRSQGRSRHVPLFDDNSKEKDEDDEEAAEPAEK
jgi:DnaK suppressor protein